MTRDAVAAELDPAGVRRTQPPDPAGAAGSRSEPTDPDSREWNLGDRILDAGRPRVMGILNLTPDSFSDGGQLSTVEGALRRAEALVGAGADILDVGGESTRPGAPVVPAAEEERRILPLIREAAARFDVPVSVDTRKAEVARAAIEAGARIVNDVSGLTHDPDMAPLVAVTGVGVVVMHMRGTPKTMRSLARYDDVVAEVADELLDRVHAAREAGIEPSRIVLDPGIGFAKDAGQSLRLLRDVGRIVKLGRPVLVGPSRKSFLGAILGTPAEDRLEGTLAACAVAHGGGARIFRVHDVGPAARLLKVLEAIRRGSPEPEGDNPGDGEGALSRTRRSGGSEGRRAADAPSPAGGEGGGR